MMSGILERVIARFLLAPILVTAAAFLIKGYSDTGDGFSAGVIAATGILLQFITCGHRRVMRLLRLSHAAEIAFLGLLLTFAVTFLPALMGEAVLSHMPAPGREVAHLGTLEIHTAVLFDIGVFLLIVGFSIGVSHIIAAEADGVAKLEEQ